MKESKGAIGISMHSDPDLNVMAAVAVLRDLQDEAIEPDTVIIAHDTLILFAEDILQGSSCPRDEHTGGLLRAVANSAL
ncbi:MAG TPA: hypothetical protein VMU21_09385 [Thermodesulfovibrionales bacterium]|nr:hypothetical protein [Thermodesulfovibrionales bacterium]